MNKYLTLLVFVLGMTVTANAQLYVGLHGGITLPSGYYAESKMSDGEWLLDGTNQFKVGAGKGFAAGLDIAYAMPFLSELSILLEGEFMQSEPNTDVKKYHEAHADDYEYILPKYRHIPIFLGFRYSYPLGKYYDLYGEALGGVNIRSITPYTRGLYYATYENSTTIGFRIGAGIIVCDMVTLGASYSMLGKSPLEGNYTSTNTKYYKINPTLVSICLGFRINPFKGLSRHVQDY